MFVTKFCENRSRPLNFKRNWIKNFYITPCVKCGFTHALRAKIRIFTPRDIKFRTILVRKTFSWRVWLHHSPSACAANSHSSEKVLSHSYRNVLFFIVTSTFKNSVYSRNFLCEEAKIKQHTSSKKKLCEIGELVIWESRFTCFFLNLFQLRVPVCVYAYFFLLVSSQLFSLQTMMQYSGQALVWSRSVNRSHSKQSRPTEFPLLLEQRVNTLMQQQPVVRWLSIKRVDCTELLRVYRYTFLCYFSLFFFYLFLFVSSTSFV